VLKPHEFLYEGHIHGSLELFYIGLNRIFSDDPQSEVSGTLLDGIFDGFITTGDGQIFTVEKAARYFANESRPKQYHSVIYADHHINHALMRRKRDAASVQEHCKLTITSIV
jgi:hypothetical protein